MRQFIHHRVQRLGALLAASVPLLAALRAQAHAFEPDARRWLGDCASALDELGLQSEAATLARLQAEFELVASGVDARTGSRVDTYRRQFRQAGWTQVLGAAQAVIQEAHAPEQATLAAASTQLGKMLISALQTGSIDATDLRAAHETAGAEALWRALLADPQLGLVARQLLLTVIDADAALLIADLARRLHPTPTPSPAHTLTSTPASTSQLQAA